MCIDAASLLAQDDAQHILDRQGSIPLLLSYMPNTSLIAMFHLLHGRYLRVQVAVLLKESDHTSPWTFWIIEANSHSYKNPIYINEQPATIGSQH